MSFKWESEKVAQWRLKARHGGLDGNERLLYQDYQQTLALANASVEAEDEAYSPKAEKRIIFYGAISLALVALIGLFSISGCKLFELNLLVPYTSYQLGYALTGEMPNANEALMPIADEVANDGYVDFGKYAEYIKSNESSTLFDEITGGVHHLFAKDSVRDYLLSDAVVSSFMDAVNSDAAFRDSVYGDNKTYQEFTGGKQWVEDLGKPNNEQQTTDSSNAASNGGGQALQDLGAAE